MSSAGYTNRIRTRTQANLTKVQYPTKQSVNYNPLQSAIGCNPNYSRLNYIIPCCKPIRCFKDFILNGGSIIVFYTLNGGTPTLSGLSFSGGISLGSGQITYRGGIPSSYITIPYNGGTPSNTTQTVFFGGTPTC
jgi:hypothetical protein